MKIHPPWRIVLMARSLGLGGSERQLAEVATTLDRRLFDPVVGCFDASGVRADDLRRADVPIVPLPVRSFANPQTVAIAWSFARQLRRDRAVLVHPFDVPTTVFGVPVARAARVPVVLSSQRGDRRLFPRAYQRAMTMTDHLVRGIVVNSDYIRGILAHDFDVPDERMYMCRNGVDVEVFHSNGRARRPELLDGGIVVGIVAALRAEKSIETLIDAFARLNLPASQLLIVGEGPERDRLLARAADAGVATRTVFASATFDVASWYRSIDVFVLPSTNESFSNSLMEAMSCGCAVLASNVGGNPELVRDGRNGILFTAGDAADLAAKLQALATNPELRSELAAEAVRTIREEYTRETSARRFGDLYQRFLTRFA